VFASIPILAAIFSASAFAINLPAALPRKAKEINPVNTQATVLFVFIFKHFYFRGKANQIFKPTLKYF
jgi:hypothetical protein